MDDDLIAAVAAGDDSALRELFPGTRPGWRHGCRRCWRPPMLRTFCRRLSSRCGVGAGGYRPDGIAAGWLWGIARRQAALILCHRGPAAMVSPLTAGWTTPQVWTAGPWIDLGAALRATLVLAAGTAVITVRGSR